MLRQKREVVFGKGELTRTVLGELREADGPLTSRKIAQSVMALRGDDPRDSKYVSDLTKRVAKALRALRVAKAERSASDLQGNAVWTAAT